jgi:hypothetical protein
MILHGCVPDGRIEVGDRGADIEDFRQSASG